MIKISKILKQEKARWETGSESVGGGRVYQTS